MEIERETVCARELYIDRDINTRDKQCDTYKSKVDEALEGASSHRDTFMQDDVGTDPDTGVVEVVDQSHQVGALFLQFALTPALIKQLDRGDSGKHVPLDESHLTSNFNDIQRFQRQLGNNRRNANNSRTISHL